MQINGVPNKFEIFQEYYYETNGRLITYAEALRLFSKLDDEQKFEFEQYYKDETGYEIIEANGFNLAFNSDTKEKTNKSNYINIKYTIEAYAKKNGITLDPIWGQYSAEEIILMQNQGVNIPQDVIDIAHSIYESTAANLDDTAEDEAADTTEKEPFLNLIPKASKKIAKCNENNEKIDEEIDKLLPEKNKHEKSLSDKMKAQENSLKEYEGFVREWRKLQNKVNNGETLTDSEAKRYAQLTGMLDDGKSKDDSFEIDKREIAKSLNEINILAMLGETLADETIEISDTLADYTSKANYKTTRQQAAGQIGFLAAIIAMAQGKKLADETGKIGNDTKEFTGEVHKSVIDIAQVMDIESNIINVNTTQEAQTETTLEEQTEIEKNTPKEAQEENETVNPDNIEADNEVKEEAKTPEVSKEEDFIVNDDSVKTLIKEAVNINTDLTKQTINAAKAEQQAKTDTAYSKAADKKLSQLIKEYKQEEDNQTQQNQDIIDEFNENNKDANSDKIEEFKLKISKEYEFIKKAIPLEMKALETDQEYSQQIIPQDKEQLSFTLNNGKNLSKMGAYRITVGLQQIMAMQYLKGSKNVAAGTISSAIGLSAMTIASTPVPKISEKATDKAVKEEGKAVDTLGIIDNKISSVTGEQTVTEQTKAQMAEAKEKENNEQQNQASTDATKATDVMTDANVQSSVEDISGQNTRTVAQEPVKPEDPTPEEPGVENTPKPSKAPKKDEGGEEGDKDKVDEIGKTAKDDGKDSEKVKKDTDKDEKQLAKETKQLEKEMLKDQKEIIKMTKESQTAAKKQEDLLKQYETVTSESEELTAEVEQKQQSKPVAPIQEQQNNTPMATNSFSIENNGENEKIQKLQENEVQINTLGTEFKVYGNKITRNQTKIKQLQEKTKTSEKKINKKCKIRQQKLDETQKKEQDKQKRLAKQLGIVGIQENIFSITTTTGIILIQVGTPMAASVFPPTAAMGAAMVTTGTVMKTVGTIGTIACGVTKGIINIANGNLTAGLISIGSAAVTAAMSMTGTGAAASSVMQYVSAGLQVVSSSTELVNNVRAVQGKEANSTMSKISTLAGIGSSVTNAASGLKNAQGAFGTATAIASAVGTAASAASQIMSTFNLGDEKTAKILGMVGGGLQTAASIAQMAQSFTNAESKNQDNEEKIENLENNNQNEPQTDEPKTEEPNTDEPQNNKKDETKTDKNKTSKKDAKDDNKHNGSAADVKANIPENAQVNNIDPTNPNAPAQVEKIATENTQQMEALKSQQDTQKENLQRIETNNKDNNQKDPLELTGPKTKAEIPDDAKIKNIDFHKKQSFMDKTKPYFELVSNTLNTVLPVIMNKQAAEQDSQSTQPVAQWGKDRMKRINQIAEARKIRQEYYRNYRYTR